jgi:hypothetical protein
VQDGTSTTNESEQFTDDVQALLTFHLKVDLLLIDPKQIPRNCIDVPQLPDALPAGVFID